MPTSMDFQQNTPTTVLRASDGTYGATPLGVISTDGGASWIRINDDAHQYAGIDHVTGDMRTFGTVSFSGSGRGILWGTSAN